MDINHLSVTGQFDDADDPEELANNNNDIILSDDTIYSDDDYLDYLDYEKELGHDTPRAIMNIANFEEKVDLSYRNKQQTRITDKSDNATSERVLDKRSRAIMQKMMRQGEFTTVNGCISAGKEANVYHAPSCSGEDLVLKVYMTSIMPFRSRQKYMRGDQRFCGAATGTSTKLVTTWAEKEFRNLRRMHDTAGAIACPRPIKQRGMVVLMSMIGSDGVNAPRLKDVSSDTDPEEWADMYLQVVAAVRIMFRACRLVHADLSEYNLLYHDKRVFVIDVSQSVEHEHPEAFNFLRKDCGTVNTFFRNKNIATLSLREFFFFIISTDTCEHTDDDFYPSIRRMIASSTFYVDGEEDGAFSDIYIERRLGNITGEQIHDQYKQILKNPDYVDTLLFAKVAGIDEELRNIRPNKIKSVKKHKRTLRTKKEQLQRELAGDEESASNDSESEEPHLENHSVEEVDKEELDPAIFARPKIEDSECKKMRKKQVKELQRDNRVTKKQEILEQKFRTISGFKYKNMTLN